MLQILRPLDRMQLSTVVKSLCLNFGNTVGQYEFFDKHVVISRFFCYDLNGQTVDLCKNFHDTVTVRKL